MGGQSLWTWAWRPASRCASRHTSLVLLVPLAPGAEVGMAPASMEVTFVFLLSGPEHLRSGSQAWQGAARKTPHLGSALGLANPKAAAPINLLLSRWKVQKGRALLGDRLPAALGPFVVGREGLSLRSEPSLCGPCFFSPWSAAVSHMGFGMGRFLKKNRDGLFLNPFRLQHC